MKNREIIAHLNALNRRTQAGKLNIKVVHTIAQNTKILKSAAEPYETALQELLKQYDVKFNDNGTIDVETLDNESRQAFMNELDELLNIEVEIDVKKVNIDDFGNYEITDEEYAALKFMIE